MPSNALCGHTRLVLYPTSHYCLVSHNISLLRLICGFVDKVTEEVRVSAFKHTSGRSHAHLVRRRRFVTVGLMYQLFKAVRISFILE